MTRAGPPDALLLDVGGVLLLPDPETVCGALGRAGIEHDPARLDRAHYAGVAAIDAPGVEPARRSAVYRAAFMEVLGVAPDDRPAADAVLAVAFRELGAWTRPADGAVGLLRACVDAGVPVAIVSNWDGTVAKLLAAAGICQVGPGEHEPVAAVVDSAVVGFEKPDPRIFRVATDTLGVRPDRAVHVGDSRAADVAGALAAGVEPIHLDPYRDCPDGTHAHARGLADVAVRIGLASPGPASAVAAG